MQPEVAQGLYAQCAEARHFSLAPPLSGIAGGFLLRGQLAFQQGGGEEAGGSTVEQDGELWLGGPARLRFSLSGFGRTNLFLLADAEHSWVRVPGKEFLPNPPAVLAEECLLRWTIMRFPWGWEQELAAAEDPLSSSPSALLLLSRETPFGTLELTLDQDRRPLRASVGNAMAEVGDWRAAPATIAEYPHHWRWPSGDDLREEQFTALSDQAFFLDDAFRPPRADHEVDLKDLGKESQFDGEQLRDLSLREGSLAFLTEDDASTFDQDAPAGSWWRHQNRRYYLPSEQSLFATEAEDGTTLPYRHTEARQWLRWTTTTALNDETARARLEAVASQLQLESAGTLWSLITDRADAPRMFLLPVRKAEEKEDEESSQ